MDTRAILGIPIAHRRTLLVLIFVVVVVLFLSVWAMTNLADALRSVMASLVASFTTAFVIVIVSYYLLPNEARNNAISEVAATDLVNRFNTELSKAQNWYFAGNLGRYLRSRVLKELSAKGAAQIFANILDPSDATLIRSHFEYRQKITRVDQGAAVDERSILVESLVTIVVCGWYSKAKNIGIHLRVHKAFSPVRIDASDARMFLTVEDRRQPGLEIGSGHFMYSYFRQQLEFLKLQGRAVSLAHFPAGRALPLLTKRELKDFLDNAGFSEVATDDVLDGVLMELKEIKDPYQQ